MLRWLDARARDSPCPARDQPRTDFDLSRLPLKEEIRVNWMQCNGDVA